MWQWCSKFPSDSGCVVPVQLEERDYLAPSGAFEDIRHLPGRVVTEFARRPVGARDLPQAVGQVIFKGRSPIPPVSDIGQPIVTVVIVKHVPATWVNEVSQITICVVAVLDEVPVGVKLAVMKNQRGQIEQNHPQLWRVAPRLQGGRHAAKQGTATNASCAIGCECPTDGSFCKENSAGDEAQHDARDRHSN